MKRIKTIEFIAVLVVIGFSALTFTVCDDGGNKDSNPDQNPGKQAGAVVTTPTLNSKNSNSITVNEAGFHSGNPGGQTIEYGRNTANNAP